MGCDIHVLVERKSNGAYESIPELENLEFGRSYGVFGFLANVRNYSMVPPISEPRGIPEDASDASFFDEYHSCSWLSTSELLQFDYDQTFEDLRCVVQTGNYFDHGATAAPGDGRVISFREFLGGHFFEVLEELKTVRADRIVFGFDS